MGKPPVERDRPRRDAAEEPRQPRPPRFEPSSERRQKGILDPERRTDMQHTLVSINRTLDAVLTDAHHVLVVYDPAVPHQARHIGVGTPEEQREALRAVLLRMDAEAGATQA